MVEFLLGMRHAGVAAALSERGFTPEELGEGWRLVAAMTNDAFAEREVIEPVSDGLAALTAWEREWFPIAAAALRARHPPIHAVMFDRLGPTKGHTVIVAVDTFLHRLAQLESTDEGRQARALLAVRGLDARVVAEARAQLASLQRVDLTPSRSLSESAVTARDAEREAVLWRWYLEWSAVARVVIRDKHQLRALGFRPSGAGSATDGPEPEPPPAPTPEPAPNAPTPSTHRPAGDAEG